MKRLKLRHLLLVLAMLPLFLTSCKKDEELVLDFDITVPNDWSYFILASEGSVYYAYRNPLNVQDTVVGEWMYVYKSLLSNYDLASFYVEIKADIEDTANLYYVSTIESKDTSINGTDFKRLISNEIEPYYTPSTNYKDTVDLNRVVTRYFFYKNSYGYILSMYSIDTIYYKNKPVFDEIMHSFHFKN